MYARAAACSCAEMASSAPCPVASARAATAGRGFAADTPAARCDDETYAVVSKVIQKHIITLQCWQEGAPALWTPVTVHRMRRVGENHGIRYSCHNQPIKIPTISYGLQSRWSHLRFQHFPLHHVERVALCRQAAVHRLQRRHIRVHKVCLQGTRTP